MAKFLSIASFCEEWCQWLPGHHEEFLEPGGVGAEIAVSPGGVQGHEDQVRQDDVLREAQHQRHPFL